MNTENPEFRRIGYFILFLICLVILTLSITFASYICSLLPSPLPPEPVDGDNNVNDTDTDSNNQTTITVAAEQPRLDQIATVCSSYDQSFIFSSKGNSTNSSCCCCSICLMDYKDTDVLRMLPACGHFFHVRCVDPWLRINLTCPVCRRTLQSI